MNPFPGSEVYSITKGSFTHLIQHLADEVSVDRCQILSFHPGRIFSEGAVAAGYSHDTMPWDSGELHLYDITMASTNWVRGSAGKLLRLGIYDSGPVFAWKISMVALGCGGTTSNEGELL